ncbi:MAG: hypothetical protein [Caudoviricetes sp.]|nr:MAG: hypothetical protein [Caudoviricetes sp.]
MVMVTVERSSKMNKKYWFNIITCAFLLLLSFIFSPLVMNHDSYSLFFSRIDEIINCNIETVLSKYGFITMIIISCLYILALIH